MTTDTTQRKRLAPGTRLGAYTIVRLLGEGGMGTVYEGVHEALGKRVAVKTLHADVAYSSEAVARFVREGRAAAMIDHPHVVDVADVGVQDGTPYLVMEYLEGEDLGSRMEHEAPMGVQAVADCVIPVVSALSAAHASGVVHRDLKPDNIFLTRGQGGAVVPKLVDFGISKLRDSRSLELTGTHAILGTPYYMSPEQAGSAKLVDHRSDIFSLGVILYQCVTHELPFKGDSLYQLLGNILHGTPRSVRSLNGRVPAAFEAIVERAMRKDPAERYQSVAEIGGALLPWASERVRLNFQGEFAPYADEAPAPERTPSQRTAAPSTFSPTTAEARAGGRHSSRALVLALAGVCVAVGVWLGWSRSPDPAPAGSESVKVKVNEGTSAVGQVGTPGVAAETPVAPAVAPPAPLPDPIPEGVTPDAGLVVKPGSRREEPVEPPAARRRRSRSAGGRRELRPEPVARPAARPATPRAVPTVERTPSQPAPATPPAPTPNPEDLFRDRK